MIWGLCRPKKEKKDSVCGCTMQHASEMKCSDCGGYTVYTRPNSAVVSLAPQKRWQGLVPLNHDVDQYP